MGELRRISNDDLVIAILSLWFGVPASEIKRTCDQLSRNKAQGREKTLPELERIATEKVRPYKMQ